MSDRTSKKRKSNNCRRREIRELLNDHYARTQEQEHIQFWFSLVFNALALIAALAWLGYAIKQAHDMTKLGLLLGLALNTLFVRIYRQGKETHQRAFKLHDWVRLYDAVMSISDEAARNAALSKLTQDLVQARSSTESMSLFGEKLSLSNLVTKTLKNYHTR